MYAGDSKKIEIYERRYYSMKMYTMYKVKIKHYNHIFKDTIAVYRNAVDFLIGVCNENWSEILYP